MEDDHGTPEEDYVPYADMAAIDFGVIPRDFRLLPFFEDDLYLGMQASNVGLTDSVITEMEYALREEWIEIERTPTWPALTVSAMSQMWVFGLYEVLRMWRERRYQFRKWFDNAGVDLILENMVDDDSLNIAVETRRAQLKRFRDDQEYRAKIESAWSTIEPVYRMVELFRMNLAKHCAPGKDGVLPRAPGYGRINAWCGAMDYELIDKAGWYYYLNRRDIADALRNCLTLDEQ